MVALQAKQDWMLPLQLGFMLAGAVAELQLEQPTVVAGALGQDVVLPCRLTNSQNETLQTPPVLYWLDEKNRPLLISDHKDRGRLVRLDLDRMSPNKSVLLRNIQWSDSQKYECKLSITTNRSGSTRIKGNGTTLLLHDGLRLELGGHDGSLLRCEVNVSRHHSFSVVILKDSSILQSSAPTGLARNQNFVSLSENISLQDRSRYECHLRLDNRIIMVRSLDVTDGADYPEPWVLYTALLLVPLLVLVFLLTALLRRRQP